MFPKRNSKKKKLSHKKTKHKKYIQNGFPFLNVSNANKGQNNFLNDLQLFSQLYFKKKKKKTKLKYKKNYHKKMAKNYSIQTEDFPSGIVEQVGRINKYRFLLKSLMEQSYEQLYGKIDQPNITFKNKNTGCSLFEDEYESAEKYSSKFRDEQQSDETCNDDQEIKIENENKISENIELSKSKKNKKNNNIKENRNILSSNRYVYSWMEKEPLVLILDLLGEMKDEDWKIIGHLYIKMKLIKIKPIEIYRLVIKILEKFCGKGSYKYILNIFDNDLAEAALQFGKLLLNFYKLIYGMEIRKEDSYFILENQSFLKLNEYFQISSSDFSRESSKFEMINDCIEGAIARNNSLKTFCSNSQTNSDLNEYNEFNPNNNNLYNIITSKKSRSYPNVANNNIKRLIINKIINNMRSQSFSSLCFSENFIISNDLNDSKIDTASDSSSSLTDYSSEVKDICLRIPTEELDESESNQEIIIRKTKDSSFLQYLYATKSFLIGSLGINFILFSLMESLFSRCLFDNISENAGSFIICPFNYIKKTISDFLTKGLQLVNGF